MWKTLVALVAISLLINPVTEASSAPLEPTQKPKILSASKKLSKNPLITAPSNLSNLATCKTKDLTPRSDISNGFPRPAGSAVGKYQGKILVVPISFTDFPYTSADFKNYQAVVDSVTGFYARTSYSNVNIGFELLPKEQWVEMGKSAESYNLLRNKPQQNNTQVAVDALALVDQSVNFDNYIGVVLTSARFDSTGGGQGFPGQEFKVKTGTARGVSLEFGNGVAKFEVLAHELGHSLFGLEDLYVFLNSSRPTVLDPTPAGSWDIMSNSASEFFGWSKLLNGWLQDRHVRCISNQKKSIHYLEHLVQNNKKPKLLLVNLREGVTLAVEVRGAVGYRWSIGLLVYKIDTQISHGDGPIIAQKDLLMPGQSLELEGWKISSRKRDSKGVLFEVSKIE